jgi:eukaryotic-like serine/threonine-protein kinase
MDAALRRRIEALFDEALEQPSARRADWLASACTGDVELRREVEALLAAHELAERLETRGPAGNGERRVGPYRLLRELGRGGMGVVYLAERDDGHYRRRVAIKLLRGSPDADELHRRFRSERQILASLAHPNIAQLLDGGVSDGDLPYLVMEYVDGLPITTYCDRHRLDVRARLRLFQEVCAAVHHAHQNLIIHRDLKPGNILITPAGQVKLLDFGIAKLLNPALGDADAPLTRTEFRVLTPEYASPEQVRGETLTTASDVYALGVILYELLAGRPPYRLTSRSARELAELIEEREPERPSARLLRADTEGDDAAARAARATSIAAARDASLELLQRQLRGDLDAIVMMALRKEPSRRYTSADLLAADIQHYLDGLPVLAHRGSRWYRIGKVVRRHRVAAAATVLVVLSLVGGAAAAAWQAAIARRERDRAEVARIEAERAHAESELVATFLMDLFAASDPLESLEQGVTARDLLRRGAARMERLSGEPLVQAQLLEVVGRVYRSLGDYTSARAALERALSARRALLPDTDIAVTGTMHVLADVIRLQGRYQEALEIARTAHALRAGNGEAGWPDEAEHVAQIGGLLVYAGDLRGADEQMLHALELRRRLLGGEDTLIAASLERVGAVKRRLGDNRAAEHYVREAIELRARLEGERAAALGPLLLRLGDMLSTEPDRYEAADSAYRRAVAILRAAHEPTHHLVLLAEGVHASFRSVRGFHDEAVAEWRRLHDTRRRVYGPDHLWTVGAQSDLARALIRAGQGVEAEALLRDCMARLEPQLGAEHSLFAGYHITLATALEQQRRWDEAEREHLRGIHIRKVTGSVPLYGLTLTGLAEMRLRRGDYVGADSLFRTGVAMLKQQVADTHHDVRRVHGAMAQLYQAQGRLEEAEQYRQLAALR